MTARSWAVSLALHGLAVAAIVALVPAGSTPKAPEPWLVSLVPAPAAPTLEPAPQPEPPPRKPVQTAAPPARPLAMPSSIPTPAPTSNATQIPKPVAQVTQPREPVVVPNAVSTPVPVPVPSPSISQALPEVLSPKVAQAPVAEALPARAAETPRPHPRVEAPPPPSGKEAQQRWYAALAAKLAQMKRYPLVARRNGQEGVVVLEARFREDGAATASIKQSSGHASLDRAAMQLFEDAVAALEGSVPPAGGGVLEIPVAYRLES